jgi:hypothetical protein
MLRLLMQALQRPVLLRVQPLALRLELPQVLLLQQLALLLPQLASSSPIKKVKAPRFTSGPFLRLGFLAHPTR